MPSRNAVDLVRLDAGNALGETRVDLPPDLCRATAIADTAAVLEPAEARSRPVPSRHPNRVRSSEARRPGRFRLRYALEAPGLAPPVDAVVESGVVGVAKPDPGLGRRALDPFGVTPERAMHVGDLHAVDVGGARAAGVRPVLRGNGPTRGREAVP